MNYIKCGKRGFQVNSRKVATRWPRAKRDAVWEVINESGYINEPPVCAGDNR